MSKKKLNKRKKASNSIRFFPNYKFILATGLLLIGLSAGFDIYQRSLPIFIGYKPEVIVKSEQVKTFLPKTLIIPEISVNLNIESAGVKGNLWQISETGVSHLNTSGGINGGGNIVIYGHNRKKLLANLPSLKRDDLIYLLDESGKAKGYLVFETLIVSPGDVWILDDTGEEILTVYTCTGFLDSKRFVVRAKPIAN